VGSSSSIYNFEFNLSTIGNVPKLPRQVCMKENHLASAHRLQSRACTGLSKNKRWIRQQKLTGLHSVPQANVEKCLDVLTSASEEIVEVLCKRLNVSGLARKSEHSTTAKQKLVANLVLSKRDVSGMNALIKRMKRRRSTQCGAKRNATQASQQHLEREVRRGEE
jgi:hypothetical protein